jgi:predicted DNA-binding protein (MmcQ/YjbR family)
MVTFDTLKELSLSFPEVIEEAHFEKTSFRVNKKIFVTYDQKQNRATVKLPEMAQEVFSLTAKDIIYPVDNKWGKQGWTIVELDRMNDDLFNDIITVAYCEVAPKKLTELIRPNDHKV